MHKYIVKFTLLFLFTALALIPGTPIIAADSNLDGQILYVESPKTGETYVSVINPDGTGQRRISPAYFYIIFPKYNSKIDCIGFTNHNPQMSSEIYFMNRDGSNIRKILDDAVLQDFSPNGKYLLYTTPDRKAELYVYDFEKKLAVNVSQNLRVISAEYSPDGEWIVASVMTDAGTTDLYLISTMAQGIKRLTNTKDVNESCPCFSKDGQCLIYSTNKYDPNNNVIEFMELKTQQTAPRTISGLYPCSSPDDQAVVYEWNGGIYIDGPKIFSKYVTAGTGPCWVKWSSK